MRKVLMVFLIALLANGCVASRKFVRNEVKTTSDALNGRIDKNTGEIGEVRDGVTRADSRITGVDGRVTQLDTKTNDRFDSVNGEVANVDKKAGQAQASADRTAADVVDLDGRFSNRNLFTVDMQKSILFKFDSAQIDGQYFPDLEAIAGKLQQNPDALLVLEGRTDSSGDKDYNVTLGDRRVEAVKRYLAVEMNVPVYRMHQISFGASKPIASNDSKDGRLQNRAVVLMILIPKVD